MDYILDLGLQDYEKILKIQRILVGMRNSGRIGDILLFLEHPDTYTAGIHRDRSALIDPKTPVIEVERGGAYTYHGPGQLVIYFIIDMKDRRINVKDLITAVEETIIGILDNYGIKAEGRLERETGVWTNGRKICSIGFAIREFSTFHGIALNVSTDLTKFHKISPCGFDASVMTSMEKETGRIINMAEVKLELENALLEKLSITEYKKYEKLIDFQKEINGLLSEPVL
ncbi:MAG: lipoyl(octanoyl) transferase LipB [Thermoplasmataceae archaeon]